MDQHSGVRKDHRSRARPDAGAAAQSSELRLRRPRGLSRRHERGRRVSRRRRRLQHGPQWPPGPGRCAGRTGSPPRYAEQSGGARSSRARPGGARGSGAIGGRRAGGGRHRAERRDGHAGTRGRVGAARLGPVDGARRESGRRDVPHTLHRLSAGERRHAADGLQHRHRLSRRRAEQAVRGPQRHRRIERRPDGSGRRPGRRCASTASACRRGPACRARRLAAPGQRRGELDPLRVCRSPHDVRSAVEPGLDQGADRAGARNRPWQAADRAGGLAPSLRPHRRHPSGDRRRADDHRPQGNRRAVPGDCAPKGHDSARCARSEPEAVEVQSGGRPPASRRRGHAGRPLSRGVEQPHGGSPVRVRPERPPARRGRLLRRRLGAVLVAEDLCRQHRVPPAPGGERRAGARARRADHPGAARHRADDQGG